MVKQHPIVSIAILTIVMVGLTLLVGGLAEPLNYPGALAFLVPILFTPFLLMFVFHLSAARWKREGRE